LSPVTFVTSGFSKPCPGIKEPLSPVTFVTSDDSTCPGINDPLSPVTFVTSGFSELCPGIKHLTKSFQGRSLCPCAQSLL
jgi:hypothetical protein